MSYYISLWVISHIALAVWLYKRPKDKWVFAIPLTAYCFIALLLTNLAIFLRAF